MSTIIRSALVAVAVLAGVSAAQAQAQYELKDNGRPLSSYNLNDADDAKAFWDALGRNGASN